MDLTSSLKIAIPPPSPFYLYSQFSHLHYAPLQWYMGALWTIMPQYAPPSRNVHHGAQGRLYFLKNTGFEWVTCKQTDRFFLRKTYVTCASMVYNSMQKWCTMRPMVHTCLYFLIPWCTKPLRRCTQTHRLFLI